MEKFQTYPLSISSKKYLLLDNDKQNLPRFTSLDSGVSFSIDDNDYSDDESSFADECDFDIDQETINITKDVHMASQIHDNDKKFFCENTAWAWHGEFGRLIMATAMKYNVDYRLILAEDYFTCPRALNAPYSLFKAYNAKAQFKCDSCGHCWTSMRARCSFHVWKPNEGGIVLLKLYTQRCQSCYSIVDPLWYYDEICRVMKNLASTIFQHFFPHSFQSIYSQLTNNEAKSVRRVFQRRGHMHQKHNSSLCEACHVGVCYA